MNTSTDSTQEAASGPKPKCPFQGGGIPIGRAKGLGLLGATALSAGVSIAVAAAGLYVYDRLYAEKVVAFDLPGYVEAVREEVGRGTMTEEQMAASLANVERLLSEVSPNHVVLSREVVLRNARELALPMVGIERSHDSRQHSPPLETGGPETPGRRPEADRQRLP